jgi:hypothetical protein
MIVLRISNGGQQGTFTLGRARSNELRERATQRVGVLLVVRPSFGECAISPHTVADIHKKAVEMVDIRKRVSTHIRNLRIFLWLEGLLEADDIRHHQLQFQKCQVSAGPT